MAILRFFALSLNFPCLCSILEIANEIKKLFSNIGKDVIIKPAQSKDEVQRDARNIADPFINERVWQATTSVQDGLKKVFEEMKNDWQ